MALSFAFGGDTGETPESIKRKREIADALIGRTFSRTPQNIGEGLSAIGQALAYRRLSARAAEGEKSGLEKAGAAMNSVGGALAGPQAFPSAPGASSADGDSVSASPMVRPDDPNLPSRLDFARADARAGASGSLPSSFMAAVDSAEGGGDYDTLYGFAQRDGKPFAGTRVSNMSVKDAIAFADPSGPYAQSVKGQIGRVATPMGRHQIVGTTLRNAVSEMGLDPNTPFNRQTQDAIAGHLARKRIAGETTMDGKVAALRSEWHGFKNVPTAQMRQIVADLEAGGVPSAAPVQVASLDPSAGMAEALRPMPEEYSKNGMTQATWERMNAPNGAVPPPSPRQNVVNAVQQAAPQQPQANPQIAQALVGGGKLPVTAGGTGGAIEYGPQGGPSIQMLMQIANEPFLNDNQRSIVNALIGQQVEASDPMRQLQMRKLQQDLNATPERKTVTINGRLVDAQTGQEIANFPEQPKAPDDPTDVREYKFYVDQEKAANREPIPFNDWQLQGKRAGATTVTVGGEPADGALRKKLDEKTGELWSNYQQTGATSAATAQDMQVLDELIKVAPQGPITGRLAELFPGVSSAGDAFQSIVKRIAPTLRAPGSGATSDIEYDGMLRSLPALRNRPEANAAISQIMKAKAAINVERSGIVDAYGRGEISAGEARNKIAELDKRSILTPELSQAIGDLGGEGGGPMQGAVVDGYRFKGGDPADPNSWEQVQ